VRSLPAEFTAELIKDACWIRHLITITIFADTIYRWTDCDQDVWYGGYTYPTKGIRFDPAEISLSQEIDSISFEVDNIDKSISALALSTNLAGKETVIQRIVLDKNIGIIGSPSTMFLGYLDTVRINRRTGKFEVFNHLIRWKAIQCPKRIHSPTCNWIFKSSYCGYVGAETWCDHTWERCVVLNNKTKQGGFPSISKMVTKEIWWGRKPR